MNCAQIITRKQVLTVVALCALGAAGGMAQACFIYDGNAAGTHSTLLTSGDRSLEQLAFVGSPTVMTGADFLRFSDGYLMKSQDASHPTPVLYGWNAPIPRDVSTAGNLQDFNPDRADLSTPYAGEGGSTGTLAEVFGPFGSGYKNMSRLLDGEEVSRRYYVDLYFGSGMTLSGDSNNATVELAVLERGGNSGFNVYGILAPGSGDIAHYAPTLTSALQVDPGSGSFNSLWSLDTLEIDGAQGVRAYGISLDSAWTNLVGVRIESNGTCFAGPDIVGLGAVPEPATLSLLAMGGLAMGFRRRRAAGSGRAA
ncbi:MAG: exosortase-dependent surface protein XDP2 [Phycisphaerae bacterium]|jgi:hypothetical protein